MTNYVVDASVAAKWYLPEEHFESAAKLLNDQFILHVPDLFYSEIASVLWKRVSRSELDSNKALEILNAIEIFPFKTNKSNTFMVAAFEIACQIKCTVYDSLYLAIAVNHNCQMVTADKRFYNTVQNSNLSKKILWVGNLPESLK